MMPVRVCHLPRVWRSVELATGPVVRHCAGRRGFFAACRLARRSCAVGRGRRGWVVVGGVLGVGVEVVRVAGRAGGKAKPRREAGPCGAGRVVG